MYFYWKFVSKIYLFIYAALIANIQAIEVRFDTGHFLLISQQIDSFNINVCSR